MSARTTLAGEDGVPEEGLPRLSRLPWHMRLVVGSSVAADLALRTAVASLVAVPGATWVLARDPRADVRQYAFYRELAAIRDPERSFPPPAETEVSIERPGRLSFRAPGGRVEALRFESPFVPVNPALRDHYAGFEHNRTAWAQHWRHDDGPRPTLCVIHGFMASPYWFNSAFFSLPRLYRDGYDVLLYLMPFHGLRQHRLAPFSGWSLFAHGLSHFNEAIAHAVHDFRVFADHLESQGVERIGVTGLSLGGYLTALLAAVEPRLRVAVPNAPVTSIGPLIREWFPANLLVQAGQRLAGVGREELDETLAVHSPLTYDPALPRERLMIIGGLGDRLAPPEQSRLLWEHWGRPRLHWYPGNHTLHVNRSEYHDEMDEFMAAAGFTP